jgi:hypothetical protein
MFLGSGLISLLVHALHPAWWAILYQLPLAFGAAYVVARQQARPEVAPGSILQLAAVTGLGGTIVFSFFMMLNTGLLMALLGIAAMWVGTSFGLDKYLDVDWESSQRITGVICVPIWLAWLIIGGFIIAFR